MSDPDDTHNENVILNLIQDPIDAAPQAVLLRSAELPRLRRSRIVG
jgi:hypothetical protein